MQEDDRWNIKAKRRLRALRLNCREGGVEVLRGTAQQQQLRTDPLGFAGGFDELWDRLQARHGKQNGTRAMVAVVALGREFGHDRLRTAIAMSVLALTRPVRLVEMRGPGLQALGTDNAITTDPYDLAGAWADALHGHPDEPDGIAYASRHDPDQLCVALFSPPTIELEVTSGPTPLVDLRAEVAGLLRRYGKGLA